MVRFRTNRDHTRHARISARLKAFSIFLLPRPGRMRSVCASVADLEKSVPYENESLRKSSFRSMPIKLGAVSFSGIFNVERFLWRRQNRPHHPFCR